MEVNDAPRSMKAVVHMGEQPLETKLSRLVRISGHGTGNDGIS